MSTINSMLYSIQNQAPALLQAGLGRSENYQNLSSLASALFGDSQWAGLDSAGDRSQDMVSLAFQDIGRKIVTDMAGLTAEAVLADPSLDNDYFIALIEADGGREARVYRRSEILAAFEGPAEEKKALEAQLAANSLQVFSGAEGLPPTSDDPSCRNLAAQMDGFLKLNSKTLNTLNSAGYDPFLNLQAGGAAQQALAAYKAMLESED
jgi:hypothetical protein